jgi:hypothetical protein
MLGYHYLESDYGAKIILLKDNPSYSVPEIRTITSMIITIFIDGYVDLMN